jgi:hypothetical protein
MSENLGGHFPVGDFCRWNHHYGESIAVIRIEFQDLTLLLRLIKNL